VSEGKPARQDQASDQLLGAAGLSVERMPMLHVIFDQMTNLCAESLRSMSPASPTFSITTRAIQSRRCFTRRPGTRGS
jgi:flagellar motor switch protein FliM